MSKRSARRAVARVHKEAVPRAFEQPGGGGWVSLLPQGRWETDFQRDIRWTRDSVLANAVVFACITLIASDVGKLGFGLVEKVGKIWRESENSTFSPVLRKPNHYQTRQQFLESWTASKMICGNAYILKERDRGGVVRAMYVLNPARVQVKVSESGKVFYDLSGDDLAHVPDDERVMVPASEIIHDRLVGLFHDLCGTSPLFAAGLAANQANEMQRGSTRFFRNGSRPSVVLSAPAQISDGTAKRVQEHWEREFTGDNVGRVAVLGDGLEPKTLTANAEVSQLVEQLKLTAEMVCTAFHVPGFKVGVGAAPTYQNAAVLNQVYYTDCIQKLTEAIENLMDDALGLLERKEGGVLYGTAFNLDDLLKMDGASLTNMLRDQVGAGITKIDEARQRLNYEPTEGGDTPYLQVQNYSLAALAKRDAQENPFAPATAPTPTVTPDPEPDPEEAEKAAAVTFMKSLERCIATELACG